MIPSCASWMPSSNPAPCDLGVALEMTGAAWSTPGAGGAGGACGACGACGAGGAGGASGAGAAGAVIAGIAGTAWSRPNPSVPAAPVGKFPPKICCKAANMGCDMGWLKTLTVTLVALATGRALGLHPSAAKSPGFVGLPGDPWHGIGGGTCPMSPLAPAAPWKARPSCGWLGTRGSTDPWGHPGPPGPPGPGTAMATHDGKESSHVAVEEKGGNLVYDLI